MRCMADKSINTDRGRPDTYCGGRASTTTPFPRVGEFPHDRQRYQRDTNGTSKFRACLNPLSPETHDDKEAVRQHEIDMTSSHFHPGGQAAVHTKRSYSPQRRAVTTPTRLGGSLQNHSPHKQVPPLTCQEISHENPSAKNTTSKFKTWPLGGGEPTATDAVSRRARSRRPVMPYLMLVHEIG